MTSPSHFTDPAWSAQITSDEEAAAMAWLTNWNVATVIDQLMAANTHIPVLQRLLARPVMPEEPSPELLLRLGHEMAKYMHWRTSSAARIFYDAVRSDLSRPPTKEVEVWRVEFAQAFDGGAYWMPVCQTFKARDGADAEVARLSNQPNTFTCIRVTGPHKQTVPA